MTLTKLYNPKSGIMKIAGLISGSGSNLRKIIEHGIKIESEQGRAPYQVAVIFSDNFTSNAGGIGRDYDIPVFIRDIADFYKQKAKPRRDFEPYFRILFAHS